MSSGEMSHHPMCYILEHRNPFPIKPSIKTSWNWRAFIGVVALVEHCPRAWRVARHNYNLPCMLHDLKGLLYSVRLVTCPGYLEETSWTSTTYLDPDCGR